MHPLNRRSDAELNQMLDRAIESEHSDESETLVRNWMLASIVAELIMARLLIKKWGIDDKLQRDFDKAENLKKDST